MVTPTVMTPTPLLLSYLLFPFLFCSLLLRSIFFPPWPYKRLIKHDIFFYITSDLRIDFGATSANLFTETDPRYT